MADTDIEDAGTAKREKASWSLVTGAAGFVGSHLVDRLLADGRPTIGVASRDARSTENLPLDNANFELIEADTRETEWWNLVKERDVDTIFHLAANASVKRSAEDPRYDLTTNVLGTLNLLELAKKLGTRFVFISSAAVYGPPEYVPMDEQHPLQPISHYGVSKLAGEQYVELYRTAYGLDTRTIRFFNCYGPRQPRYIVFDYLRKAYEPGPTFEVLGTGQQVRTQLFVSDAVEAVLLVAAKGDHAPYNVGSEEAFTVLELAERVLALTGQSHRRVVTTGHSWQGDIDVLQPDIARLKSLGFQQEHDLDSGLAKVLKWWIESRG